MSNRNEVQSAARRRILKRLAAGGSVLVTGHLFAQQWVKPVVESVILPAHAQATVTNVTVQVGMSPQFSTFDDHA
jgi:hypothetical protein